ncbi:hypothetical protein EVAR_95977_1 [Eumeta japonica]|uniref:Uncharacterized protein n=1 Tax=Eumeta variegata TaxID=151549 RepID=A0A4C1V905_EUMVA|nr:hypothetical protein EVAR_95977_1 [Eumeta japonica]
MGVGHAGRALVAAPRLDHFGSLAYVNAAFSFVTVWSKAGFKKPWGSRQSVTVLQAESLPRAIRECMVIAAHGQSQPQRSRQCVVGFLERKIISDGEG